MQNEKLIHSTTDGLYVYLGSETDDDADLSHLGKFTSNVRNEPFYYDRQSGELRDSGRQIVTKDSWGDIEESDSIVADVPTRGRESGTYEFIADFTLGWELDGNSKEYRKAFAQNVADGSFKKFGINPKRCKGRRSGYWMAVLCMCFDAKRMEDYGNYWWMEFHSVEVRDEACNVLAQDGIGGIESDYECDEMKEHFDLETLLRDARISRGDVSEILKKNGQLELVF